MIIASHNFIIESISDLKLSKDQKNQYIELVLKKEGVKNEIGEPIFQDDFFQTFAFNNKAKELANMKPGDKIQACLNIQGRRLWDQQRSEYYFTKQLLIHKITKTKP